MCFAVRRAGKGGFFRSDGTVGFKGAGYNEGGRKPESAEKKA
jgi:hypothetical protein